MSEDLEVGQALCAKPPESGLERAEGATSSLGLGARLSPRLLAFKLLLQVPKHPHPPHSHRPPACPPPGLRRARPHRCHLLPGPGSASEQRCDSGHPWSLLFMCQSDWEGAERKVSSKKCFPQNISPPSFSCSEVDELRAYSPPISDRELQAERGVAQ